MRVISTDNFIQVGIKSGQILESIDALMIHIGQELRHEGAPDFDMNNLNIHISSRGVLTHITYCDMIIGRIVINSVDGVVTSITLWRGSEQPPMGGYVEKISTIKTCVLL